MGINTQVININGQSEVILSPSDLVNIAENNCGYEYSMMIDQLVRQSEYNQILAEKKAQTDERVYYEQVESLEYCMRDILAEVSSFQRKIDNSSRLQRNKVEELLTSIVRMIENEI